MRSRTEQVVMRLVKHMENGLYDSSCDLNVAARELTRQDRGNWFAERLFVLVLAIIEYWAVGNMPEGSEHIKRWAVKHYER